MHSNTKYYIMYNYNNYYYSIFSFSCPNSVVPCHFEYARDIHSVIWLSMLEQVWSILESGIEKYEEPLSSHHIHQSL